MKGRDSKGFLRTLLHGQKDKVIRSEIYDLLSEVDKHKDGSKSKIQSILAQP